MPEKFYVANKGVLVKEGRALLLEGSDVVEPRFWDLPGGRMEAGETVEQGLLREFSEELPTFTNLKVIRHLHTYARKKPQVDGTYVIVNVFQISAEFSDIVLSDEHTGFRWVTKEELLNLPSLTPDRPISPDIQQAIEIALAAR